MKLYDIVKHPSFKLSRNKSEVIKSLHTVIEIITGQSVSKTRNDKQYRLLTYKLVDKYDKREFSKEKFMKLEQVWLETQEVSV